MARSVWKGPFLDNCMLKYAKKLSSGKADNKVKKIWSRRSAIIPAFIGRTFAVYNGKVFIPVTVTEAMLGYKFGDFAPTRTFRGHAGDKKVVKGKK